MSFLYYKANTLITQADMIEKVEEKIACMNQGNTFDFLDKICHDKMS